MAPSSQVSAGDVPRTVGSQRCSRGARNREQHQSVARPPTPRLPGSAAGAPRLRGHGRGLGSPGAPKHTRAPSGGTSSRSRCHIPNSSWGRGGLHGACPSSLPQENWGVPSLGINPRHQGAGRGCHAGTWLCPGNFPVTKSFSVAFSFFVEVGFALGKSRSEFDGCCWPALPRAPRLCPSPCPARVAIKN